MSRYYRRRDGTGALWPFSPATDRPDLWEVVEIADEAIQPVRSLERIITAWFFREYGPPRSYGPYGAPPSALAQEIREAFPEAQL